MTKLVLSRVSHSRSILFASACFAIFGGSAFGQVAFPSNTCNGSGAKAAYDQLFVLYTNSPNDPVAQQIYADQATWLNSCCSSNNNPSDDKLCACHSPYIASSASSQYNQNQCTTG
ncbi:hypothetical protein [Tropicimonas sediminicola]|uniref:Lysozyme inhibitor LprI N-terminal domain-containing protein n=1 Tax=Tropicimonas sediminicola TaxID=1031541 RepID=A0A239HXZ9_9RHOB|nr:hypothetical protein [Tropicimonas sediminicola]SNS86112.1 hypothetical protein SAMN05421757_10487 [Tropicimonas sediminicola]